MVVVQVHGDGDGGGGREGDGDKLAIGSDAVGPMDNRIRIQHKEIKYDPVTERSYRMNRVRDKDNQDIQGCKP